MFTTSSLIIREAAAADVAACLQLDLAYETDYVWQIDVRDEFGAIAISFRTARLPRVMRVVYPRETGVLESAARSGDTLFLIAETSEGLRGYLTMRMDAGRRHAWITDIGVGKAWRRQKVGTALFQAAYRRALESDLKQLTIETQSKNYPAICFCQKNGLTFCGFNDRYYLNHDIALFFGLNVRA